MATVLLSNGLLRMTLAAVRSLGKNGISTIVVEETRLTPAAFSKYCTKSIACSKASKHPQAFYEKICKIIEEERCEVFFPMDEDALAVAIQHREELNKICVVPLPPEESYRIISDKGEAYKYAEAMGVAIAKTSYPKDSEDIIQSAANLNYPLMIKPVKSNGGRGIKIVNTPEELKAAYIEVNKDYKNPIIQEFLGDGDVYDVVLLYNAKNELRASFIQKHVRKYPLETGPSSVQESVYYPEMLQIALEYMKGLKWYGIADLEFFVQRGTGRIYFLELNPRFWNSLQMGIYAGVNFPWLLYKMAIEGDVEEVKTYKSGVRCRNLLPSDILHYLANKDRKNMNPPFWSGKKYNMRDDIISKEDPLPVFGFFLACLYYLFDLKMWRFLLRI